MARVSSVPADGYYVRWGKRALDLTVALVALVVLAPVIAIVAVCVRIALGAPVLFRQERPGLRGSRFELLKFRTMTDAVDNAGRLLPDGLRLNVFGRFLRASSLDELPELLNVIRGEMSLVGPRPLLVRYTPYFTDVERERFTVRPGITGLSQIMGRNDLSWDRRMCFDVEYVRTCSLALDLKILVVTVWPVIRRSGLRVNAGESMLDFDEERRRAGPTKLKESTD